MNKMNVSNLFNEKSTISVGDKLIHKNNKQLFSEIFNKEKNNLVLNNEGTSNTTVDNKYTNKLSSKENKQVNIAKKINFTESEESVEDQFITPVISLLQSLLDSIGVDVELSENESKLYLDLSKFEINDLTELKHKLSLLLEQPIGENIKTTISTVTKIIEEIQLDDKSTSLIQKDSVNKLLNSVQDFKNDVKSDAKSISYRGSDNLKDIDINNKSDLLDLKEQKSYKDYINDKGNLEINNLDKLLLSDSDKSENSPKQNGEQDYLVVNGNILTPIQEKVDQIINVTSSDNEIIEPKQFINEISQKASAFLSKDRNEMSIQLTPENLGKISIKIGLNDGTLTGKIYAENYSVKEIIEANLNQLRDALEENGMNISGLEVNIGSDSQNFGNGLFQQRTAKRQNTKLPAGVIDTGFITLEQDMSQRNPYLVSGQFDGLI